MDLFTHPDFDDHELVIACTDRASGLRAFIAVHDTSLGPGMGGCRMQHYPSEAAALRDALRLSRAMSYKYAASGLSYGGAKAVIMDAPGAGTRSARLLAFARIGTAWRPLHHGRGRRHRYRRCAPDRHADPARP